MKQTILLFLLAAAVCVISVAAYTEKVYQPAEGFRAPEFSATAVAPQSSPLSLDEHHGEYVLLSFWSSTDPSSRMHNMNYDSAVRDIDAEEAPGCKEIAFLSVNFDSSLPLARQIALRDSLPLENVANVQGPEARRLIADYRLSDGFRAYLIDPEGRVVATNPSVETLRRAIAAR